MKQNEKNVSPRSNEGRNTYVIEHITRALLELLKEKNLSDISISELCDKAEVGRVSFYRNFETKEDVLKRYIDALTKEFAKNQRFRYDTKRFHEYTIMLFEHLEVHKNICLLLLNNDLLYIIGDIFDKYFLRDAGTSAEKYNQMYVSGGFFNIFKFWLIGGCVESPEELADMFMGFI